MLASSRGEPKCQPKKTFLSAIKDGSDEEGSQASEHPLLALRTPPNGFLSGGGEISERNRAYDQSCTALGPLETWPQSLEDSVEECRPLALYVWMGLGPAN